MSAEKCAKCACDVGIECGKVAFDDACPKCSGKPARQCQSCRVVYVDNGMHGCPFCRFPYTKAV